MVWEWVHLLSHALGTRTLFWFGHGCSSIIVCSRNTNVIMVWEWLHYLSYALLSYASEHEHYCGLGMGARLCALGTRTLLWCGHGCTCSRMLSEHERDYGLGMDALAFAFALPRKTRCVVYAVFRAPETLRMRGSCHANHIRRGRPGVHFLRVYAPAEPLTR